MSIWGEEVHIKLLVFQEVLSLTKTLKGTKKTKRDEPHKEERQAKKTYVEERKEQTRAGTVSSSGDLRPENMNMHWETSHRSI